MNEFLSAKSWVLSQGAEIAAQLLNYYFYTEIMWLLFLGSVFILSVKAICSRSDEGVFFGSVGAAICAAAFAIVLSDFIELVVAPKVWLLEYAAHLLYK